MRQLFSIRKNHFTSNFVYNFSWNFNLLLHHLNFLQLITIYGSVSLNCQRYLSDKCSTDLPNSCCSALLGTLHRIAVNNLPLIHMQPLICVAPPQAPHVFFPLLCCVFVRLGQLIILVS